MLIAEISPAAQIVTEADPFAPVTTDCVAEVYVLE